MKPRYYSGIATTEDNQFMLPPSGPMATYSAVVENGAAWSQGLTPTDSDLIPLRYPPTTFPPKYTHRVLLDLGSLDATGDEVAWGLLLHDPVLHAVFEYGRQLGMLRREL